MDKKEIVKDIIDVCTKLQNYLEGFDESAKSSLISSKFKALFYISQTKKCSPTVLIEKLGLAKSNIALLCKQLVIDNLIEKTKDEFDCRAIFYSITKKGEEYLNKELDKMTFNFNRELEYKNNMKEIAKLINELKKEIN